MSIAAPRCPQLRLHPWLSTLDSFGVPFLGYSAAGALQYASSSLSRVHGDDSIGLSRQAGYLVRDSVGSCADRASGSLWVQLRAAPAASAPVLLELFVCVEQSEPLPMAVVMTPMASARAGLLHTSLSARQSEVASLIASGATVKEVAGRLGISVHTARRHVEHVYRRLGLHSRAEVARVMG
jgi:DNA-binding NarL/FixJ family response regulator